MNAKTRRIDNGDAEAAEIAPWIPADARAIVDIGCGGGWVAACLGRLFPDAAVHLVDGEVRHGPHRLGWNPAITPYNDVHDAAENAARVIEPERIHTHVADPEATIPADAIMSLQSWCHHYPAETYLGLVQRSLRPGGVVVLDLRRGRETRLLRALAPVLRPVGLVRERPKSRRLAFRRR